MILTEIPKYIEKATDILALISLILLIVGLIILAIYLTMETITTQKAKNDYVRRLNEHDRSVIAYYDNIKVNPWRKKHDISKN